MPAKENRFASGRSRPLANTWTRRATPLFYKMALRCSYLLLLQSVVLLFIQNDTDLKFNLLIQTGTLVLFGLFTVGVSGTYLNAPLVFATSIFIWHSTFLLGHYFELAPIFAFDGGAFNIGFEYIYRATGLVGLSLAFTVIGMIWGYKRQRVEAGVSDNSVTRTCYSTAGSGSKKIAWYLFAGMVSILVLSFVREGPSAFAGQYIDLYAGAPSSLSALLFYRSQLFWVFVIVLLFACYKDNPRFRYLIVICVAAIAVLLAMWGARTGPFLCLTALLLSWDCFVQKVKLRWILAFMVFLSAASFVIAWGRNEGLGMSVFRFGETGQEKLQLMDLFWEQGRSITTVLRTMDLTQHSGFVYGRTFLDSVVAVIPLPVLKLTGYTFVESLGDRIVDSSNDLALYQGAGSSLIAELYYNFGMLGCVPFFLFGWYISREYFKYVLGFDIFAAMNVMTVVSIYTVTMRNDAGPTWRLLIYAFFIVALLRRKREQSFASQGMKQGANLVQNSRAQVSPRLMGPAALNG